MKSLKLNNSINNNNNNNNKNFDYSIKILIVGDYGTGKRTIVSKYIDDLKDENGGIPKRKISLSNSSPNIKVNNNNSYENNNNGGGGGGGFFGRFSFTNNSFLSSSLTKSEDEYSFSEVEEKTIKYINLPPSVSVGIEGNDISSSSSTANIGCCSTNGSRVKVEILKDKNIDIYSTTTTTRDLYEMVNGFIVFYDVTSYQTFKNMRYWINEIQKSSKLNNNNPNNNNNTDLQQDNNESSINNGNGSPYYYDYYDYNNYPNNSENEKKKGESQQKQQSPPIVIVGNKCDKIDKINVDYIYAKEYCDSLNIPLFFLSVNTKESIELVFNTLIQLIIFKNWVKIEKNSALTILNDTNTNNNNVNNKKNKNNNNNMYNLNSTSTSTSTSTSCSSRLRSSSKSKPLSPSTNKKVKKNKNKKFKNYCSVM